MCCAGVEEEEGKKEDEERRTRFTRLGLPWLLWTGEESDLRLTEVDLAPLLMNTYVCGACVRVCVVCVVASKQEGERSNSES